MNEIQVMPLHLYAIHFNRGVARVSLELCII